MTDPLLACEAVLAEAAFHLQNTDLVLSMVSDGLAILAFDCEEHWSQLRAFAYRYRDRHHDLADLCLIRMSEIYPNHRAITVEAADFKVYRRNKREAIPLICPAE